MKRLLPVILLVTATAAAAQLPPRPAEDMARDAARKPADMVAFAKIRPGSKVADIIPGGGYFTRVFAAAVGSKGHVTAIIPAAAAAASPDGTKAVGDLAAASGGTVSITDKLGDPALAGSFDVVWTAQNYHDLHNGLTPEQVIGFDKGVFAALKPGGMFVVLDHSAVAGSGLAATKTLHRIDADTVKAEVVAAGFVFDGSSEVLRNPADPRTAVVFDPAIRGKTDQFVYRFKKP